VKEVAETVEVAMVEAEMGVGMGSAWVAVAGEAADSAMEAEAREMVVAGLVGEKATGEEVKEGVATEAVG
jgi:hypothetical protein